MSGEPGEYTAGTPKDVAGLRKNLIAMINAGMLGGATPYSGPLGTTADPGQLSAMNMLMAMSGNGKYTKPGSYSMPGQPTMANAGTNPGPGPIGPGPIGPGPNPKPSPTPYPKLPPYDPNDPPPDYRTIPGPVPPPGNDDGGGHVTQPGPNAPPWTPPPGTLGPQPRGRQQALFQLINSMRGMR